MRTFVMHRYWDESGVSGTGTVLEGIEFDDGKTVLNWNRSGGSTVVFKSFEDFLNVHVLSHPKNLTYIEFGDGSGLRHGDNGLVYEPAQGSLFNFGAFTLHSGKPSDFLIDCGRLTDEDLSVLARMVRMSFGHVEGVPKGGTRFASALDPYKEVGSPVHLVVDDVLTTGGSVEEARRTLLGQGVPEADIRGIVIFARTEPPSWVWPIFQAGKHFSGIASL